MARGATREVTITKDNVCQDCNGTGVKKGSGLVDCSVCKGKGEITETMGSLFGNITRVYTCSTCAGHGKVPKENCQSCKGEGRVRGTGKLEIKIPAGIKNGDALVIKGGGQSGFRGDQAGDLYVLIEIEPDKKFKRSGDDIICELPVKITDAMLGAKIKVPTLDEEKELEIPSGTQNGDELRLRGSGVHGHRKGDQIVKIKLEVPKKMSGKAKKLAEELAKEID